ISVYEYYDGATDYDGIGVGGYGTAYYSYGYGYSGLGSESGYAYNSSYTNADNYFSSYSSADLFDRNYELSPWPIPVTPNATDDLIGTATYPAETPASNLPNPTSDQLTGVANNTDPAKVVDPQPATTSNFPTGSFVYLDMLNTTVVGEVISASTTVQSLTSQPQGAEPIDPNPLLPPTLEQQMTLQAL
ncbi:MAG: hypothetical protein ACK55X_10045, partial [Synechococcaceae cyanobacterium]